MCRLRLARSHLAIMNVNVGMRNRYETCCSQLILPRTGNVRGLSLGRGESNSLPKAENAQQLRAEEIKQRETGKIRY